MTAGTIRAGRANESNHTTKGLPNGNMAKKAMAESEKRSQSADFAELAKNRDRRVSGPGSRRGAPHRNRIKMFKSGTLVEAFFEGETPKWKLAYLIASFSGGRFWGIKLASNARQTSLLVMETDIRIPSDDHDYYRGFTYGVTNREYITSECDAWHRGYIMGVAARVGG